jgi:hypothetical protein
VLIGLVRTGSIVICAATLLAPHSFATTYVVDQNGGGQFTDIPPAIAAAQPGDVLLVMPGMYSGFTLDKGLAILGYGQPTVNAATSIVGVPIGQTALVLNFQVPDLSIVDSRGPVIAQDLILTLHIMVQQSADVRMRKVQLQSSLSAPLNACDVSGSRVEFVECHLEGSFNSGSCGASAPPPPCGAALEIYHASRVQIARSFLFGASGSLCPDSDPYGADGGPGVRLTSSDQLIVTGGRETQIVGGLWGGDENDCINAGSSGPGVLNQGGRFWFSGAAFECPDEVFGPHCIDIPCSEGILGPGIHVTPDDPTLSTTGPETVGSTLHFGLRAPPGSHASLAIGRTAIVVPDPNTRIERLTPDTHVIDLGVVPADGRVRYDWAIDTTFTPGTLFVGQATVVLNPSDVRRTNSVPIIVR